MRQPEYLVEEYQLYHFQNGTMESLHSLPSLTCPSCGVVLKRIIDFPFECPRRFLTNEMINTHWPRPISKFRKLVLSIENELQKQSIVFCADTMDKRYWMYPGVAFQPYEFEIACHPTYPILWPYLHTMPVVTEDVKNFFEKHKVTGVTFHKVVMKYVGKASAEYYPQNTMIPRWWDSEEYFDGEPNVIEAEKNPESFGPLYYMRFPHWGRDWYDYEELSICPFCEYRIIPKKPQEGADELVFREKHLLDFDFFRSPLTPGVIISEKVYDLFHQTNFPNGPEFQELEVH